MARVSSKVNYTTFVGGRVSDSNPINPPENVAQTLTNVEINRNGKIGRRLGIKVEDNFNFPYQDGAYIAGHDQSSSTDLADCDVFTWYNVNNEPGVHYTVVRSKNYLHFYDQSLSENLSSNHIYSMLLSGAGLGLPRTLTTTLDYGNKPIQAVSGKGFFLVTGEVVRPFYIKHDRSTNTWTVEEINIRVRDFEGVDDGLKVNERPETLSSLHKYNLYNQGWTQQQIDAFSSEVVSLPFGGSIKLDGNYPSNSDVVHVGNSTDAEGVYFFRTSLITGSNKYPVKPNLFGNTPAPKGHFIIDPFNLNTRTDEAVSEQGGPYLPAQGITTNRPKAVAFYAGRFFYGSVEGVIYYSQIVDGEDKLGKAYQEQDPTADELNALLDTDGGTLKLFDIGDVVRMQVVGKALVIFGTEGVYALSGGDQGFTANNQFLSKVSDVRVTSPKSVVPVEGSILFWSTEGIYAASANEMGGVSLQSLTDGKLGNWYSTLNTKSKNVAKGIYDRKSKQVYWLYSLNGSYNFIDQAMTPCFAVLVFNLTLGAFFDYEVDEQFYGTGTSPYLASLFTVTTGGVSTLQENVTSEGEIVTVDLGSGAENVTTSSTITSYTNESVRLLIYVPDTSERYRPTFGDFSSRTFLDFDGLSDIQSNINYSEDFPSIEYDPIGYTSVVETLPQTLGEPSVQKQAPYVYTYYDFRRKGFGDVLGITRQQYASGEIADEYEDDVTTQHSVMVRGKWDWTLDDSTNRWTRQQQGIKPRRITSQVSPAPYHDGFGVLRSKLKLRGKGEALVVEFMSEEGKDFQLLGWTLSVKGEPGD